MVTKVLASSVVVFAVAVVAMIQSPALALPSADFLMKPTLEPSLLLCGSGLILFARRIRLKAVDQNR
jgi:CBS-domain-containing membrane protein